MPQRKLQFLTVFRRITRTRNSSGTAILVELIGLLQKINFMFTILQIALVHGISELLWLTEVLCEKLS